ncbi:flagellar biosynthesis anti-sigma factor FlgM [Shouchella shacheensis]|uniref:flagellar biosynthesis anti-sigma factor FlgM n=1 Tax=Shouchella shacheensis TaxID=1649580 RepID=UPI00073FBD0B|nr:flagellar biosynthesis anti-sigma factor FlgM [Shouchella shacheensis]
MKINETGSFQALSYKKQMEQQQRTTEVKAVAKQDHLEISADARAMHVNHQEGNARSSRIEALKQQIESGEYEIHSQRTAGALYDYWKKGGK